MIKRITAAAVVAAAMAIVPSAMLAQARAQAPAKPTDIETLRKQVEALAAGQMAIERQLQEIKALLQQGAAAAPAAAPSGPPPISNIDVIVDTAGAASKGSPSARVTIVEFSDFQCPFCGAFARDVLGSIERDYVDTGKVRYVFRNFPLESIHPNAFKAGIAAACAAEQGKFWPMHDRLFANQTALGADALAGYARAASVDLAKFTPCLTSDRPAARLRQDEADGTKAGVGSTPTFLIGRATAGDTKVKATRIIRGAQPYVTFKSVIDGLLTSR